MRKYFFTEKKYKNTEKSSLNDIYNNTKNKNFSIKHLFGIYDIDLTWKEFWNLWLEHKKKYGGAYCAYTGTPLCFHKQKSTLMQTSNRVSVDRLDPNRGYTKENIVFCSASFNYRKGNIAGKDLVQILRLYHERQLTPVDPDLIPQIVDVKQVLTMDREAEY